jgi:hypothetical protein
LRDLKVYIKKARLNSFWNFRWFREFKFCSYTLKGRHSVA